jgi:tetratricopeptide (TPR) repeat protein
MRRVASLAVCAALVFVSLAASQAIAQPAAKPAPPPAAGQKPIRSANDLLAAVQRLAAAGRIKEANTLIDNMRIQAPAGALLPVLGPCYEMVGDAQRAMKYHGRFLQQNPNSLLALRRMANFLFANGRVGDGMAQAEKILTSNATPSADNEAHRAWARRSIATAFANADSSSSQIQQGLKLIDENAGLAALTDEDLLVKARLLARMPEIENRNQAVDILKGQIAKKSTALRDPGRLLLVQLYQRSRQWPEARKVMTELVQTRMKDPTSVQPQDLAYVSELIRMMINNGEPQATTPYLAMLEKQQSIPVVATQWLQLRAVALSKQGKSAEAHKHLTQAARDVWPPDTPEKLVTIKNVALVFAEIEGYAQAEALLRAYVKLAPEDELVLAQFLGLHGDVDEALDLCQKVIDSRPSDRQAVMQVALTTLTSRRNESTKPQIDRVAQWAAPLLEGETGTALKIALADMKGDYKTVVQVYREVLKQPGLKGSGSPNEANILNNLAFTLGHRLGRGDKIRLDEALRHCNQAIKILGERSQLLDTRAMIHFAAGQKDLAHTDMTKALKDHVPSGQATMHFHMALIESAMGNSKAAARELRTAIDAGLKVGQLSSRDAKSFQDMSRRLLGASDAAG